MTGGTAFDLAGIALGLAGGFARIASDIAWLFS